MLEHYLYFSAGVNPDVQNQFIAYLVELQIAGATKLTIALSSPGGNVVAGITMYNALISMPYEIETHNIGNSDSIATVIFVAGKKRFANPTATFMFHGVGYDGNADERLEEKNLLEKLHMIKAEHVRIASLIETGSRLKSEECVRLLEQQSTRDANWAKSVGLIEEIKTFHVPQDGNVRHLI